MSVRGLLSCAPTRLDGFAKIMFVDDLTNHTANIEDHQPPQERPSYDPPDQARIVSIDFIEFYTLLSQETLSF